MQHREPAVGAAHPAAEGQGVPARAELSLDPSDAVIAPATLSERIDDVPAGARGGVLELRGPDIALAEITEPPLEAVDRILFVPVSQLRLSA